MNLAGVVFYEPIGEGLPLLLLASAQLGAVLAVSVISLENLLLLPTVSVLGHIPIVSEALIGGWLFYWLNIEPVTDLFRRRPAER